MAGFTSVQQDPNNPGLYRATTADGTVIPLAGQPGQDLFNRFNSPRMGSTTVARPEASDASASDVMSKATLLSNPLTAPAALAYDAIKNHSKRDEPVTATAAAASPSVEQPAAPQGVPAPEAQPAQSQAGPLGYTMKGVDPATGKEISGQAVRREDGSIGIYVPGTRGSAGGLTKLGKEAIAHQGAAEEEYAKQQRLGEEARQSGADAAIQQAEAQQAYLDEARVQLQLQQQAQQDENDKIQKQVGDLQGKYDKARDDFMNSKVDPDAYMKGGKGATGVFSALGMALGAFGAALARTPNFAQEFVQSQIDRNIRAQETQIQVKGRAADNMLADLTRATGSLQNGKLAMKQLLTERASVEAQQVSQTSKNQEIAAKAKEVSAALAGQAALQDNARRQGFLEHVMSNRMYYAPGSAGRSGGFITPTMEQVKSGQDMGIDARKLALAENKAAAAGKSPHLGQRMQGQIVAARNARHAVSELADTLGMTRDDKGEYSSNPSVASAVAAKIPYSETREKINAAKLSFIGEVGKAQQGGALSEGEAHELKDQIANSSSPGELGHLIRHYDGMMKAVEHNVRQVAASSGPGSDEPDDTGR